MAVRWHGHMTFPWFSFGSPDRGLSNAFWIMWFEQELKEIQPGQYHYSQQALPSGKHLWCSGNTTSACLLVLSSIPGKADFQCLLLLCQFEILGRVHVDGLLDRHERDLEFQIGPIWSDYKALLTWSEYNKEMAVSWSVLIQITWFLCF